MAVSTRHLHRRNLQIGDGFGAGPGHESPPGSHALPPQSSTEPSVVVDDRAAKNSMVERFLSVREDCDDLDENVAAPSSWFSALRRCIGADDESMGRWDAIFLALALEPVQVRNERVIMLFEAYAIFGALFLNGSWVTYEWGSEKLRGGESTNDAVDRIFECIMAIALVLTVILALYGAWFWIVSIHVNSSQQDFVLQSIEPLVYLHQMLSLIFIFTAASLCLGIYSNLGTHLPETVVALIIAFACYSRGAVVVHRHLLNCAPLEMYHSPLDIRLWMRFISPRLCSRRGRGDLEARAQLRAEELRIRAHHNTEELDLSVEATNKKMGSVGALLKQAAINLGRDGSDLSSYEAQLEQDWYSEADQLCDMSVECLSKYMPHRLAKEVRRLIQAEG